MSPSFNVYRPRPSPLPPSLPIFCCFVAITAGVGASNRRVILDFTTKTTVIVHAEVDK